jgi:SAM-dependent methyltransferase
MDVAVKGTMQQSDALRGGGTLNTREEWEVRNSHLSGSIVDMIRTYVKQDARTALDIGAELGGITDRVAQLTGMEWHGIDPDLDQPVVSPAGVKLQQGFGHELPFHDGEVDCITFVNVFEHLRPEWRQATLNDIRRVLSPGGVLVGQLPNPYFPIESHSRLPFFGYVPYRLQPYYWRLSPTGWDFDTAHFFSVTIKDLRKAASKAGLSMVIVRNFNYPIGAIPRAFRSMATLHARIGVIPWAWQFVFRKDD